jgi:hypothetical protein
LISRGYSFAVLVAMALAAALLYPRTQLPLSFDAVHTYLPMARRMLAEGWAFAQSPESLVTGPVSFLYPALFGADGTIVRWANVALYCATIALGFHALRLSHSPRAGVCAALLLAVSPTLRPFIADVLTEPPFIFLIAVWIAAVASTAPRSTLSPTLSQGRGRKSAWIIIGGIAFALAALTRPAAMYFAPLAALVFAWRAFHHRREEDKQLAILHAIAAAGIALWVARNAITFGFPGIATGAGVALFFGANPLVDGFDPGYFGMDYDSGSVHPGESHLAIASDRILRAVALEEFRDTPLAVVAEMFARKAVAFLFVTSAETAREPLALLRSWRIALVALAVAGLIRNRKSVVPLVLGAFAAYMVAVHLPVVYHHRYSVGALDLPLTLLAAIGLIELVRDVRWAAFVFAAVVITGAFGLLDLARAAPLSPRPDRVPVEVVWLRNIGERYELVPGGAGLEIPVAKVSAMPVWDLVLVAIDLAIVPKGHGPGCTMMRLRYRAATDETFDPDRVVRVPIDPDGKMHTVNIGATVPLKLDRSGVARLEFDCASPATLEVGTMAVIMPRRAPYFRDRYLERQRAGHALEPPRP